MQIVKRGTKGKRFFFLKKRRRRPTSQVDIFNTFVLIADLKCKTKMIPNSNLTVLFS